MKTIKCIICGEQHPIDEYGWVESCIGYFDLENIEYETEKFLRK